nr:putative ribonuclease H protein At1g65750 family [Tanacetum cinerariifolium]
MVVMENVETATNVLEDKEHDLWRWSHKIRRGNNVNRTARRVTWINIMGIPISCWNEESFRKITTPHGTILATSNCILEGNQSIIVGRVQVHTISKGLIKEELKVEVQGKNHKIHVIEKIQDIQESLNSSHDSKIRKDDVVMTDKNEVHHDEENEDGKDDLSSEGEYEPGKNKESEYGPADECIEHVVDASVMREKRDMSPTSLMENSEAMLKKKRKTPQVNMIIEDNFDKMFNQDGKIFGDLNVVRCSDDRLNSQVNMKETNEFDNFINNTRLIEISMGGRKFTRIGDDGIKFSKLDRFLLNDGFHSLWGNFSVVALDHKLFDHYPIVLKDAELDFGPKLFRVFNVWMDEADFNHIVEEAWKKEVSSFRLDCRFQDKLKNVKEALRIWSKESKQWEIKDKEYVSMLRQKTRLKWDVEGDENTKFFHSYVRRRNNKCNIRGLVVNEIWYEDPKTIKAEMARHYKTLFSERSRPSFRCNRIKKISMKDARNLERDIDEKEIWEAIRGCGRNKAPGPDGFNFMFIMKTWDIIKTDLVKAIMWFSERIKCVVGYVVGEAQNEFIKVNGSPSKEFEFERGVRQGDPLAPFLFILVAEGLNAIVSEPLEKGIFIGVKTGSHHVTVSHLQCLKEVSRLRVNYVKSKLYGLGVSEEELGSMANWIGCDIGEFPFTYSGLPIGENINRVSAWKPVMDKFKNRLADWKEKTMSFRGRLTLVKSVLSSLPLYYFSVFRVPMNVLKILECIRKNLFWGGNWEGKKLSWVKWESIPVSFGEGDRWRWMLDEDGAFKVKTLTSFIEEKILQGDSGGVDTL